MFFSLPDNLKQHIYSYDDFYIKEYNKYVISYINIMPKFLDYSEEHDIYDFFLDDKGIQVFFSIKGNFFQKNIPYKKAMKKAIQCSI